MILLSITLATIGIQLRYPGSRGFLFIPLSALMWGWLSVMHSAGHRAYFRNRLGNAVSGLVASLFILVPFYPWRYHHGLHHRWTGWMDLDPTSGDLPKKIPERRALSGLNFFWKTWFPILSIVHTVQHLWNPFRFWKVPGPKIRILKCVSSVIWIAVVHAFVAWNWPWEYATILGPAVAFFLLLSDPVLMSQHAQIPMKRSQDFQANAVRPFAPKLHDAFTRSFTIHPWIDRWVFLNFNLHSAHHRYPTVPHYELHRVQFQTSHIEPLFPWIWKLKKQHIRDVLFGIDPKYGATEDFKQVSKT
ncbi:MAG: fatty acid desaturase [Bdellovibrionales bacterium]|nr:fatty acid desaturase [Bdellovibrionales bacterium]